MGFSSPSCRENLFLVHFIKATADIDSLSVSVCLCLFSPLAPTFPCSSPYSLGCLSLSVSPFVCLCVYIRLCLSVSHSLVRSPVIITHVTVFLLNLIRIYCFYSPPFVSLGASMVKLYFVNFVPKKVLDILVMNF